jgi:hypothetical protein
MGEFRPLPELPGSRVWSFDFNRFTTESPRAQRGEFIRSAVIICVTYCMIEAVMSDLIRHPGSVEALYSGFRRNDIIDNYF